MGGITVAHHESNDSFTSSFPPTRRKSEVPVMTEEQLNQLLVGAGTLPGPVEDLTGEVHDLMMREWLDPWSTSTTPSPDLSEFDAHQLSLQLESFFQDPLEPGLVQSPYYDEMTFVPEEISQSIQQQQQQQQEICVQQEEPIFVQQEEEIQVEEEEISLQELDAMVPVQHLKRRRSSSSSESSSSSSEEDDDDDDSSDDEEDDVIPTTVANVNNRQRYWSDSSDSEEDDEPAPSRASSPVTNAPSAYAYMHKRQIEETLLSKITNQLQQEKLPGILAILSSENKAGKHDDEVEIDLSRLAREQLVRLLCYVEACIGEQNGGPAVNVADYIVKQKVQSVSHDDKNTLRNKRRRPKQARKSRQELTEDILADDDDEDDEVEDKDDDDEVVPLRSSHGPMSMAELSKRQDAVKSCKKSRKRVKRRSLDDAPVSSSTAPVYVEGSIAVSRPKRSATQRKRRMSEDSDVEDGRRSNSSSGSELIVYGDEKMDFNVKDNKTIVHEPIAPVIAVAPVLAPAMEDEDDLDEEIDILF